MRNCAIIHPLHLELETALSKCAVVALSRFTDSFLLTARKKARIRPGKTVVSRDRLTSLPNS